jgi:hypothetical protein
MRAGLPPVSKCPGLSYYPQKVNGLWEAVMRKDDMDDEEYAIYLATRAVKRGIEDAANEQALITHKQIRDFGEGVVGGVKIGCLILIVLFILIVVMSSQR